MRLTRRGAALVGAAWLAAGGAAAAAPPAPAAAAKDAKKEVTLEGLRVAIDPKTGELRPLTPAETRKLQDAMRKRFAARDVELTQRSDGALSSVVAPNLLSFSVARVGAEGKVERSCVAGADEALALLQAASRAARPEEK
jgi:hypothetical protein